MAEERETVVEVTENLKASDKDGRKRAWWIKKIEALEAKLAAYENGGTESVSDTAEQAEATVAFAADMNPNQIFADGFVAAMHQFQIMNKSARQNIYRQMVEKGPGYARRLRGSRFRGFTV